MKILPYYKEDQGAQCFASISLVQNMNVLSEEDARIISSYMESCAVIMQFISNLKDPITEKFTIPAGIWSDGVYVWSGAHIHYVKNYRVRLPKDFVSHVKKRLETEFDVRILSKDVLCAEVESTMEKILHKDESCWDGSY